MSETLTHKDLARLCGVSETTIKSYRRKFPTFIPIHTEGKPIRFKKEMGDVCLKIRECFEQGMSINETYKVLKGQFKEYRRKDAPKAPVMTGAEPPAAGVSKEYLEKFFETAGQMMHGMAQLATAQARADKRLEKVEKAIEALITAEDRSDEVYSALLAHLKGSPAEQAMPGASEEKVINVRGREGTKKYKLKKERAPESQPAPADVQAPEPSEPAREPEPATDERSESEEAPHPSETFMGTPIVIRSDEGEFLGVPGRVPLSGFIDAVVEQGKETGASLSSWERRDRSWIFVMRNASGQTHELFFGGTKTPRGNLVVLFWRLDIDGKETSHDFLQEFFKGAKDRIVG